MPRSRYSKNERRPRSKCASRAWLTVNPSVVIVFRFACQKCSREWSVVRRYPRVGFSFGADVTDAREGKVCRRHPVASLGGVGVGTLALRGSGFGVGVELDG